MADDFGAYLASRKCGVLVPCRCWDCTTGMSSPCPGRPVKCGVRADHQQGGLLRCNLHLDNSPRAPRAFSTND